MNSETKQMLEHGHIQLYCKQDIKIMISARYIGRALRKARRSQNLSRKTIGKKLGVSKKQILKYENGSAIITKEQLFKLFLDGIRNC